MPQIAVVMGSDSDLPVMMEAIATLEEFEVEYEVRVLSAHRTPEETAEFSKSLEKRGIKIVIAGAGKAAHLPGFIAAFTTIPVIGVPISASFDGIDALLSIVQMPPGVPVATTAVDGAKNAALLAIEILSLNEEKLRSKLKAYRKRMNQRVKAKNEQIKREVEKRCKQ